MAKKYLSNLDLNKNELLNAVIQQLASAPSSPVQGQIYYNTTDDNLYIWDGAAWVDLTVQGGSGSVDTANSPNANEFARFTDSDTIEGRTVSEARSDLGLATSDSPQFTAIELGHASDTTLSRASAGRLAVEGVNVVTASSTDALTNKSFDANGSGNSISNLETADFAANVVDNDSTMAANSSSRLPTQQSVKSFVENAVQGLSWKQAVRVATTANGTLATAYENGDTVDGVTLATGDRILIKDQSTASENGIYTVNASGAPTRATDANSAAELRGATVFIEEGTANADKVYTQTTNATITVGSTNIVFAEVNGGAVPTASTSVAGKVELADATEAEARSSTSLATTPASLANFPVKKTFTIGDNSATQIDVTHSLGTKEVITQVRQASDDTVVECDITNFSTSVVRLNFAVAPATNALKVVVMG